MQSMKRCDIVRLQAGYAVERLEDTVIVEYPLALAVDGAPYAALTCTPQQLEDLLLGRLFGDGVICAKCDVEKLALDERTGRADVTLFRRAGGCDTSPLPDGDGAFTSGSLVHAVRLFLQTSELYRATGAVHSCALWEPGSTQPLFFREDIGRKNALDKVLGASLHAGVELARTFLLTSGRVDENFVQRVLQARIPVLVSRTAVTDAAVALAKEKNICLVGFARGTRLNVYTGEARIAGLAD